VIYPLHLATVIHPTDIHQLLASPHGDLLGAALVLQRLDRGLGHVERVARPWDPSREVLKARGAGNLKYLVGDAKSKSYERAG
jgi:hypothetical protein